MFDNQQHLKECIHICWECRDTCQDTLYNHILERGGGHIDAENIKVLTDCIQICQLSADFMRRNSPLHKITCAACAEICAACADSCHQMGGKHITIQKCAEASRRCAESCRKMANM
jgi:hypothetical protein